VLVSAFGRSEERWLLEPDAGTARPLPRPDLDTEGLCVGEDRLVVLDHQAGGARSAREERPVRPDASGNQFPPNAVLRAAVLDPAADRLEWSDPSEVSVDDGADSSSLACAGDGALVMRKVLGGGDRAHHFFDGTRWRRLRPAPIPLGVASTTAWTGEQVLVWAEGSFVAYAPSSDDWSVIRPVGEPSQVVPAGDRVVLFGFTPSYEFDTIEVTRPANR
jgi:hypothetical protein